MAETSTLRRDLASRLSRLDLGRVFATPRVLIYAAWILIAVVIWLLVLPGVVPQISLAAPGLHNAVTFSTPLWFKSVFMTCDAIIAASGTVIVALHSAHWHGRHPGLRIAALLVVIALSGYPALLMAADWSPVGTLVGVIGLAITAVVVLLPGRTGRALSVRLGVIAAATAAPWLAMTITEWSLPAGGFHWGWSGATVAPLYVAVVGGVYAAMATAQSRSRRFRGLFRRDVKTRTLLIAVAIAAAICALRLWVTPDWLSSAERLLWALHPLAWPHALLVAGLIVALVIRSRTAPRQRRGRALITGLLILGALAPFGQYAITFLVAVISAAGGDTHPGLDPFFDTKGPLEAIVLGAVLLTALLPWFRASVGTTMAAVALVYLGVRLADRWVGATIDHPQLWAEAPHVVIAILAICLALAIINLVARRELFPRSALLSLVVVPLVAVHGGLLLPLTLSTAVGPVIAVAGILAATLFAMPAIASDRVHHSKDALRFAAVNLLVLTSFVLSIGQFAPYQDPFQDLAVTWLALPIAAALCVLQRDDGDSRVVDHGG